MMNQVRLKELLFYDPISGQFIWRVRRGGSASAGSFAGRVANSGYVQIGIDGERYLAHRLAWLYVHGEMPPEEIDHIDCNRINNRMANLRLASQKQNAYNRPKQANNKSGYKGVSWHKKAKAWRAQISINCKVKCLGFFDCPSAAHAAYCMATAYRAEFVNNG